MRYSKRKSLPLAAGLACLSTALLVASEPPVQQQAPSTYQHIEEKDIYLVMSDTDQLQRARAAVQHDLIAPLTPVVKKAPLFSRAVIPASDELDIPAYEPVFAQAQNGTVPFSLYKLPTPGKAKAVQSKQLFLIGYYDVAQGRVMVFDSNRRKFLAANTPKLDLKKIGFHQDPQLKHLTKAKRKELAKHAVAKPAASQE